MRITFWALSGLINGITSTVLGLIVYSKSRKNLTNITYGLFCLSVSIWSYSYFFWQISTDAKSALFWCRSLMAGAIFIPTFYFHFICSFLDINSQKKKILIFAYIFCFMSLLFNLTPLFVKSVSQKMWFKYWPDAGIVYIPFLVIWFWLLWYSVQVIIKPINNSIGEKRNQLFYLVFSIILGAIGGATNFPLWFNIHLPPIGNILISVYVAIVAYAIVRYRLMDIKIAVTRAGIFLIVYTFVLGIPFVVLARTGSGLLATSLAVVFATLGPLIFRFFQKKAESIILDQQRHYQRILLRASMGMVTEHNLGRLSKLIVYILKRSIKLNFAAIFINNKSSNLFELKAIRSKSILEEHNVYFNAEHPLVYYLKKNHEPFFYGEMPVYIRDSFNLSFKVSIIIPVFAGSELLGFVFLGEKINTQLYTEEDINVFKILSRQAALAIENCVFFEESQESQEMMFAAEKLASIGGMADGVAHQIKNRLNQFSLASGELKNEIEDYSAKHPELIQKDPELKNTFDYLAKIARSLIENVKRTDNIIKGILDFAKVEKKENLFAFFSLKEATDLSYNLLMIKHESAQLPIKINLGADDSIYGIKSQIIEAVYNMLDNAYEATKEMQVQLSKQAQEYFAPKVELDLKCTQDRYVIRISDNGIGIKEEDKRKIFAPFFTTKSSYKSGSGIGAYVVKRIIEENHKGKIWFVSEYLKGTEFFLELPKGK